MTSEAADLFRAFYDENGALYDALPDGPLKALVSKMQGTAARLALVFHLCLSSDPDAPVSVDATHRAVHVARWLRYEQARIYLAHGFEDLASDRDERLASTLPDEFQWSDVAEAWDVKKAGAYKIIDRLTERGLVEDAGHGRFSRLAPACARGSAVVNPPPAYVPLRPDSNGDGVASEPPVLSPDAEPWAGELPF